MTKTRKKIKKQKRKTQRGNQSGGNALNIVKTVGKVGKVAIGIGYYSALVLSPLIFLNYIKNGEEYENRWKAYEECVKSGKSKSSCKKQLYKTGKSQVKPDTNNELRTTLKKLVA